MTTKRKTSHSDYELTTFCGAGGRRCIQITDCKSYIQLTEDAADMLARDINKWIDGELEELTQGGQEDEASS